MTNGAGTLQAPAQPAYSKVDQWLDQLVPDMPGALVPIVNQAVAITAHDFLKNSRLWREHSPAITVKSGQANIGISPFMSYGLVAWVHRLFIGDIEQTSLNERRRPSSHGWYCSTPSEVVLSPAPDKDVSMTVLVSLMTPATSAMVPTFLFTHYLDAITYGARARLMSSPNKPYTSLSLASWNHTQYRRELAFAREQGRLLHNESSDRPVAPQMWAL